MTGDKPYSAHIWTQRLRRAIAREGVWGALHYAGQRLWHWIFLSEHHVWYVADLAGQLNRRELAADLTGRWGTESDISQRPPRSHSAPVTIQCAESAHWSKSVEVSSDRHAPCPIPACLGANTSISLRAADKPSTNQVQQPPIGTRTLHLDTSSLLTC
jgi:hypothetical protein